MRKNCLMAASLLPLLAVPLHAAETGATPQPGLLDLDLTSIVWVLAIFIVVATILYQKAWKNVLAGLKAREARIRKAISDAEAARLAAQNSLKEYEAQLASAGDKVRDLIAKATADGERFAAQIRTHAQQEAEEIKERALQEIENARKSAVSDIYQQAAVLATNVAEKILRRNLNPDDQRDLVNQSIEQFSKVGKN
jgi:F-type H+-transporting ATPase subunit b